MQEQSEKFRQELADNRKALEAKDKTIEAKDRAVEEMARRIVAFEALAAKSNQPPTTNS